MGKIPNLFSVSTGSSGNAQSRATRAIPFWLSPGRPMSRGKTVLPPDTILSEGGASNTARDSSTLPTGSSSPLTAPSHLTLRWIHVMRHVVR